MSDIKTSNGAGVITSLNEYQGFVWDLALPQCKNATYMALGLGEAGEVQGRHKKLLRGDYRGQDADSVRAKHDEYSLLLKKELGDLLFYVAGMARASGFTLAEIATSNIEKLHDRRARGVLQGDGDNR